MYELVKDRYIQGCIVPAKLEKAVLDYIEKKDNSIFSDADNTKALENKLKNLFTSGQTVDYSKNILVYLIYYFPVNIFKIWKPLIDLSERNALNEQIRVLEIGSGPGSSTFGLIEFYRLMALQTPHKNFCISIILVEQSKEFIDIYNYLLDEYRSELPKNLKILTEHIHNIAIKEDTDFLGNNEFDLIYASNVFNSNENYGLSYLKTLMTKLKSNLLKRGSIILIEPAENSKDFLAVRNELAENHIFDLFSPCNSVYKEQHPLCCAFSMARTYLSESKLLTMLKKLGIITNKNPLTHNFQYAIFRKDGLRKYDIIKKKHDLLCDIAKKSIGDRVNIYAIVVSTNEKEKNTIGLYLCDGSIVGDKKVWLNLSADDIHQHNITEKIFKGERLTILGAIVESHNRIKVDSRTQIEVIW